MIRFKLPQRMADLSQKVGRRLTLDDVSEATGIHRTTLSRMNRLEGTNVTTDNLDRLCHYLGCDLHELVEYIRTDAPPPRKKKSVDDQPGAE
jgi:putative transcriptional regulator